MISCNQLYRPQTSDLLGVLESPLLTTKTSRALLLHSSWVFNTKNELQSAYGWYSVFCVRNHKYVVRPCAEQFCWLTSPISQEDLPILPAKQLHQPLTIFHCCLLFTAFHYDSALHSCDQNLSTQSLLNLKQKKMGFMKAQRLFLILPGTFINDKSFIQVV